MSSSKAFSVKALQIDPKTETERITAAIKKWLLNIKKKGAVVAISGGVDSSVVAALCARALGKKRVLGLLLPEKDSSPDTLTLSELIAKRLEIETINEDITPILQAVGCYKRRDEAIRQVIPNYSSDYKCKIALPSIVDSNSYRIFSVIALSPDGKESRARLTPPAYLGIVAASNFKQRVRKMLEYYHADRLNYAVTGTPNRVEYDQGFFVKNGDGSADIKPIAHLYKTQVYQIAEYLGIPEQIRKRLPTTDTYSMPQSQEEFYFSLPYDKMDLCLYAKNQGIPLEDVAEAVNLKVPQVERVFHDIDQKRKTTRYLHLKPQLLEKIGEH